MKPSYFDDSHVVQTGTTTVLLAKRKTPEGN